MASEPYLGSSRRLSPGAGPQGGFPSLDGLIDWKATERNRALSDLLRKINVKQTEKNVKADQARRSANREMRRQNTALQKRVRETAMRQAQRNARAGVKLARIARAAMRRNIIGAGVDLAVALAGRAASPDMTDFSDIARLSKACPPISGIGGCNRVLNAVNQTCLALQASPADGSCNFQPVLNVSVGSLFTELAHYPVPPITNWREGSLSFWIGTKAALAVTPAGRPTIKAQPAYPAAGPNSRPEPGQVGNDSQGDLTEVGALAARWPAAWPEAIPINKPVPLPRPMPRKLLKLRRALPAYRPGGLELSGYGYSPANPDPFVEVAPAAGPTIEVTPFGPPRRIPPEHKFAPPGRKTKEMKTGGFRLILAGVNAITESKDFIDGLYEGVDDACKKKWAKKLKKQSGYSFVRPQDKLRILAECAGPNFDFCKATKALVENQVEDFVFGKTGQRLGKLANQFGPRKVRIGFQAGGSLGKVPKDTVAKGPDNKKPWDKWTDAIVKCE